MQENVWTPLEVLESMKSVIFNLFSRDLNSFWQVSTNFHYQIFNLFDHEVGVISRRNLSNIHKGLNFLDGQRVEEHTDEL